MVHYIKILRKLSIEFWKMAFSPLNQLLLSLCINSLDHNYKEQITPWFGSGYQENLVCFEKEEEFLFYSEYALPSDRYFHI